MGHAALAVKMLTEASEAEALEIAQYLEEQNRARQAMERGILATAIEQVETGREALDKQRALVLGSDDWHPGVIGIVAARLVERYCRPTVMVSFSNGHGQGSGRSVPGFHLANALSACSTHLSAHGGHEMAAGLKIERQNFDAFRRAFTDYAGSNVSAEMMRPRLQLEAAARIAQLSEALVSDLQRLGPFGHGNRKPLWLFRDVQLAGAPRVVGKAGNHLQLWVRQGNARVKCIAFGQAGLAEHLRPGTPLELAAEPILNRFNGTCSVELQIKDMRVAEAAQ
jgi:single-stranded-DNA-specific exonuclease